jgi:hypothetical protein
LFGIFKNKEKDGIMKRTFFAIVLFTVFAAVGVNAGWMSRYWDGCKPSCSWSDKKQQIPGTICKECDKNNNPMKTSDQNKSACDQGGTAYTCWDMIPFADPKDTNQAYGFAAAPTDQCGKCFKITFDGGFQHGKAYATHAAIKGKIITVMASNMGWDVAGGQFDMLIPGGGLGNFDAFSPQLGVAEAKLGKRSGGLLSDCEDSLRWDQGTLPQYQKCLRDKCNDVFKDPKHALLKQGCNFYADWFMAANNPTMTYEEVTCPQILIDRYTTGGNTPTPGPTYTLTVKRNPEEGGTTEPATDQKDIEKGTQVNITAKPADGYTFGVWVITDDSGKTTRSDSVSATVTVNGNVTVTANFIKDIVTPPDSTISPPDSTIPPPTDSTNSVRNVIKAKTRVGITLKSTRGGFNAYLPTDHGYTSYRLIDLQGREIRSGKIGAGVNDLSVGGLKHSVFFLRLSGGGKAPVSLKVINY